MPKIRYKQISFSPANQSIIASVNRLITTYQGQGYTLTLRQLYYQFVAQDLFPPEWADPTTGTKNIQKNYKKLGVIVNDGRLAGLIDWNAIEDRTRSIGGNTHWDGPDRIISSAAAQFALDKWEGQPYRVEVWVEKDALEGVVSRAARRMDVDYFSCRGYTSQTSMWEAGSNRLKEYAKDGAQVVILHLGDHDPSGIDMSRDIEDRLKLFMEEEAEQLIFKRIALTLDQVEQYNPPPNPAKTTDTRYAGYIAKYGDESWELDALEPSVLTSLITDEVEKYLDRGIYRERERKEEMDTDLLQKVADEWDRVSDFVGSM
jgi:hypothetical protein